VEQKRATNAFFIFNENVCERLLHLWTTHVDAAYCYRPSSVVCLSVCLSRSWAKNRSTDRDVVWDVDSGGPKKTRYMGMHIGPTWRTRLNRRCAAAMRPYVKLRWPLVHNIKLLSTSFREIGLKDNKVKNCKDEKEVNSKIDVKLECGPMPNVMVALSNIGGTLCSTPQSLADAQCRAVTLPRRETRW